MISPELLRRYPFFGGLTEDQLRGIAMLSEEEECPAKTLIFVEGQPADKLYVLIEGDVELLYSGGAGSAVSQAYVGSIAPGEVFAVSALLEPYRLTAAARTEVPVKLVAINAVGLRAMCEVDTRLGYTLMRHLAQNLSERLNYARAQLAVARP